MYEIDKFRRRLSNLTRGSQLFTMTSNEALSLLDEIDSLIEKTKVKIAEPVPPVEKTTPSVIQPHIIDGGTF